MANIVVFVEARDSVATDPSLFAVSEARRVASDLGATVYAVVTVPAIGEEAIDALARALGEAGANRILCCADAALAGAPIDATVGPVLAPLAQRLRPVLVLFPAGGVGPALGPPLAARLRGLCHPRAALDVVRAQGEPPRLAVRRLRAADGAVQSLDLAALAASDRPVVATLAAGSRPSVRGEPTSDVEMLTYAAPPTAAVRELSSEPDDGAAVELASSLTAVDPTLPETAIAALRAASNGTPVLLGSEHAPGINLACPAQVLVGAQGPRPAALVRGTLAPSTRVAVVGSKAADKGLGRLDVVLRVGREEIGPVLGAALRGRRTSDEEAAS